MSLPVLASTYLTCAVADWVYSNVPNWTCWRFLAPPVDAVIDKENVVEPLVFIQSDIFLVHVWPAYVMVITFVSPL